MAQILSHSYAASASPVQILEPFLKVFLSGKADCGEHGKFNEESWDYRQAYLASPLGFEKKKKIDEKKKFYFININSLLFKKTQKKINFQRYYRIVWSRRCGDFVECFVDKETSSGLFEQCS